MHVSLAKTLREQRAGLVEQNRAVLAAISGEKDGARIKELETQWDTRDNEIEALGTRIERAEKQDKLDDEQTRPLRRTEVGRHLPALLSPEQKTEVAERYKRAYWDNLRGFQLEADDAALLSSRRMSVHGEIYDVDKRAQSSAVALGGYAIPQGFVNQLEKNMIAFGGVRPMATILRTAKGNRLPWPTVSDAQNEALIIGEGAAIGGATDMTFGEVAFGAFTFRTLVLASFELLQDEDVNLEGFILDAISERFARGSNKKYTVGAGTTEPKGFITSASSGGTGALAAAITFGELVELEHSVDPAYRSLPGVGFQLHDTALKLIKKLVDSTGQPLWLSGVAFKEPNTILGYPYAINQHMAVPAINSKSVAFGAFKKFVIRDVQDVLIVRANELHLANGQVGFYAFFRTDSQMLDAGTDPVKYLTQAAA